MNRWGIPDWLENEVRQRDASCVYCGMALNAKPEANEGRRSIATWEHIVNDATIVTLENIALCCNSCNASKGAKELRLWLDSDYCKRNGITRSTVARVVKAYLASLGEEIPEDC